MSNLITGQPVWMLLTRTGKLHATTGTAPFCGTRTMVQTFATTDVAGALVIVGRSDLTCEPCAAALRAMA